MTNPTATRNIIPGRFSYKKPKDMISPTARIGSLADQARPHIGLLPHRIASTINQPSSSQLYPRKTKPTPRLKTNAFAAGRYPHVSHALSRIVPHTEPVPEKGRPVELGLRISEDAAESGEYFLHQVADAWGKFVALKK
jgi:hypothetical protein